jgi:hypothetical protein
MSPLPMMGREGKAGSWAKVTLWMYSQFAFLV